MSMIKVEDLTFSYPTSCDNIFERVNFQIDTNWKLGFVGRNGRGKTTFLKLLLGEYEYSGKITASVGFDYFPYTIADKNIFTQYILRKICPDAQDWEIVRELSLLDVDSSVLFQPFCTLSSGEQVKVLLAALFLNKGRFLLIDEPTNHLDAKARELTAAYLKKKKGFILISHDRRFLDSCTDHILSLNKTNIEVRGGNFSAFMQDFECRQLSEAAQNERLQKDIARLSQSSRRSAEWSYKVEASKKGAADKGYIGHKAAKMMKRSKATEARRQQAIEQKSALLKNAETAESLKIYPLIHHCDTLASFSEVAVRYGEKTVCAPVTFSIKQGERIALNGRNGSGKSSLLKLLCGEPIEHSGQVSISSGLIVSYLPQESFGLCGSLSAFAIENGLDESLFKAILRKMDFERIQFEKDMSDFSQGQKKKVLIAKSLCEKAHLYVWDEPLNYIDIFSRMQIERLISDFSPTIIFVEHDRAFQQAAATKFIEL